MEKRQFVGKSLDDALEQAARDFNTDRDNLSYNIVPEEGGGLLKKLLFRSVRVEAWVEQTEDLQAAARRAVREAIDGGGNRREQKSQQAPAKKGKGGDRQRQGNAPKEANRGPDQAQRSRSSDERSRDRAGGRGGAAAQRPQGAPAERGHHERPARNRRTRDQVNDRPSNSHAGNEAEPRTAAVTFDSPGVTELLRSYTDSFLKVFDAGLADVSFSRTESGDMSVTVKSALLEDLLQRSDKLVNSYEHVFKRIVQKKFGDLAERLVLDAGAASERRRENLQELARSLAAKVKETGKSITLNSRSGQERRVIHLTIDEIEGVATRSIGTGEGRKLVIYSTERSARRGPGRGTSKNTRRDEAGATQGSAEEATEGGAQQPRGKSGRGGRRRDGRGRNRSRGPRPGPAAQDHDSDSGLGATSPPAEPSPLTARAPHNDDSSY